MPILGKIPVIKFKIYFQGILGAINILCYVAKEYFLRITFFHYTLNEL